MIIILKRHRLWFIPLFLGAVVPPLIWFFCFRDYIVPGTKYKRSTFRVVAQYAHASEEDVIALERVENKMVNHVSPNEADWQQIKAFATGANDTMKGNAIRTLSRMSKFGHQQECIELVQTTLNNPANQTKDIVVADSLASLYEMQAPDWRDQLNRFRDSRGAITSFVVAGIKKKAEGR